MNGVFLAAPGRGLFGLRLSCAVLLACISLAVQADLSIIGTRFIYPAGLSDLTIRVGNVGQSPLLLQAWLDKGDAAADPSRLAVPFVLSPPLARLDPQQRSTLSVRYTGEPLPTDRESVFWLNFLEVPSLQPMSSNQLRMSYRLRMKLLYRPEGLPGIADEAVRQMSWTLEPGPQAIGGPRLKVSNPTPFYVSLAQLDVGGGGQGASWQGITVEPYGSMHLALPAVQAIAADAAQVRYHVVLDSGETLSADARVQQ